MSHPVTSSQLRSEIEGWYFSIIPENWQKFCNITSVLHPISLNLSNQCSFLGFIYYWFKFQSRYMYKMVEEIFATGCYLTWNISESLQNYTKGNKWKMMSRTWKTTLTIRWDETLRQCLCYCAKCSVLYDYWGKSLS